MSDRSATVTDEAFTLDPALLGRPLASVRRRALAFALDGFLALALGIPLLLAMAAGAVWLQTPETFAGMRALLGGEELDEQRTAEIRLEFLRLVHSRRPDLLPSRLAERVVAGDAEGLSRIFDAEDLDLVITLDSSRSRYDSEAGLLHLNRDILFGRLAGTLSLLSFGIAYFSLLGTRGRPPGKWLTGIRVVRLDGGPLTLWTAFQRAGGYSASVSTLGLGFLQATRDPNRRALHDQIAGTVVLREPRPARIRPALAALGGWLGNRLRRAG